MTPATGMPGTTGTIRHPDVSEISDLTEGLLSPSRTAEVRRHLGDCALCADVRASLEEIRSLLGTLPGPARMPADIAGRIDAALAAEALLDSTAPPAATKRSRPAADPVPPATDIDVSRETSLPAAARPGARLPSGHPSGPTGPGRRRARRRITVLAGLAGAAACALGIFLFGELFGGTPAQHTTASSDAARSAAQPPAASGAGTYTAQDLQSSVHRLLSSVQAPKTVPQDQNRTLSNENTTPTPELAPGDRPAPAAPACVQEATGRPDAPLASERGSYQGTAVYLLVLPHPGDSTRIDAYLVDAGCENTASATPGKPLLTSTYPRS